LSTTFVQHVPLHRPTKSFAIVLHGIFIGAMLNVWWAQWFWWGQVISCFILLLGYVNGVRRYLTLTHPAALRAITWLANDTITLHYFQRMSDTHVRVTASQLLPWVILLHCQWPQRCKPFTLVLLRQHMTLALWRRLRLRLRLLYSSL
jgi:hypothetical protein